VAERAHPRLSLGTPVGAQPAFAQGSSKQTQPGLSKELRKQRDLQHFAGLCPSAVKQARQARNVLVIPSLELVALVQPAALTMGRVPPGMGAAEKNAVPQPNLRPGTPQLPLAGMTW